MAKIKSRKGKRGLRARTVGFVGLGPNGITPPFEPPLAQKQFNGGTASGFMLEANPRNQNARKTRGRRLKVKSQRSGWGLPGSRGIFDDIIAMCGGHMVERSGDQFWQSLPDGFLAGCPQNQQESEVRSNFPGVNF